MTKISPSWMSKLASMTAGKWPAAYAFLKDLKVDAAEQQQMMLRVDKNHEDLDKVAKDWIDQHQAIWQAWLQAAQS